MPQRTCSWCSIDLERGRRSPFCSIVCVMQARIRVDPVTLCWVWTGSRNPKGYGLVTVERRTRQVHRLVYELLIGEISDETLDHLCRNPPCCNPGHVEPVTNHENVLRGLVPSANRTVCRNGRHVLDIVGIYVDSDGTERCHECRLESKRRYERRRVA